MLRLVAILLFLLGQTWANPAIAGPWPRAKGDAFLAFSTRIAAPDIANINGPYSIYSSTYIEYGLTEKITIGIDLGHAVSGDTKAVAFLRYPLGVLKGKHRVAFEIGVGIAGNDPLLRPGMSYGFGFSGEKRSGWFTIDAVTEYRPISGQIDLKADITLGINHTDRVRSMFQFQTGISTGDPAFIRFAPAIIVRTRAKNHIEIGADFGILGDQEVGVKIGFWREF